MAILDFIWGPKDDNPIPRHLRRSSEDGWQLVTLRGGKFTDASTKMYVEESNSSCVIVRLTVEDGILSMLESSIEGFIQQDYSYDHIPVDATMKRHPLVFAMQMPPKTSVKCKRSKSDIEYITKDLWTIGTGITIHGKADVCIEKVEFEYREVDGQLIENTQCFRYTNPRIDNCDNEMIHWEYFD